MSKDPGASQHKIALTHQKNMRRNSRKLGKEPDASSLEQARNPYPDSTVALDKIRLDNSVGLTYWSLGKKGLVEALKVSV